MHPNTTHGMSSSLTYKSWEQMRQRCSNPKHHAWHRYGGRNVQVCPQWDCFEQFLQDMGERPLGTSIGRIGDEGNYEPGNCAWQTRVEQTVRGSRKGRSKLTEEQVLCAIALRESPKNRRKGKNCLSVKNMAADLNVNSSVLLRAINGQTWSHI